MADVVANVLDQWYAHATDHDVALTCKPCQEGGFRLEHDCALTAVGAGSPCAPCAGVSVDASELFAVTAAVAVERPNVDGHHFFTWLAPVLTPSAHDTARAVRRSTTNRRLPLRAVGTPRTPLSWAGRGRRRGRLWL